MLAVEESQHSRHTAHYRANVREEVGPKVERELPPQELPRIFRYRLKSIAYGSLLLRLALHIALRENARRTRTR